MLHLSANDKLMSGLQFRFVVKIRKLAGKVKGSFFEGLWRLGFKFGRFESPLPLFVFCLLLLLNTGPIHHVRKIYLDP
jgi:hypothetical protein